MLISTFVSTGIVVVNVSLGLCQFILEANIQINERDFSEFNGEGSLSQEGYIEELSRFFTMSKCKN